ncbi:hypothetical protein BDM02DRAFT_3182981 [Thelephora ganbajun]|uniref:Uncharacterized protein n=1 Tax=Thelephora ganbajun TaxID=370292 RepID=A0ACB6ZTP9_THEGA|nr:hypothetical protein BDM02DRAFT_3182981 [Thelephora ganbajun]
MLHQASLPLSFWGKALAAFIHVWNRTPTSAVPSKIPWETKIQKDKREWGSLGSHMEKCIFIGYPPDYKGWRFYNPHHQESQLSQNTPSLMSTTSLASRNHYPYLTL